ncbi:hypothetical protein Tco_0518907, partial [Tanacetum coccineum]
SGGEVEWWWHLRRIVLESNSCESADGGGLRVLGRKSIQGFSKEKVVSRVALIGMFWIGEDSFDERSMTSVLGAFLHGFWVEELALEAMRVMIKERI